jgi:hypothetical protein
MPTVRRILIAMLGLTGMLAYACASSGGLVLDPSRSYPDNYFSKHADIDIAVSLGLGTVRTPPFVAKDAPYSILIQAEKRLPFQELTCKMALAAGPLDLRRCGTLEPLVRADWRVLQSERVIASGWSSSDGEGRFEDTHVYKFLGSFMGEPGQSLVVEVTFTRDGTPLNVTNPKLIVVWSYYA